MRGNCKKSSVHYCKTLAILQPGEQEKYLEKHVVHLGVGTPNRIFKLIKSGEKAYYFQGQS